MGIKQYGSKIRPHVSRGLISIHIVCKGHLKLTKKITLRNCKNIFSFCSKTIKGHNISSFYTVQQPKPENKTTFIGGLLNAARYYCSNLQWELSTILSCCIKLSNQIKSNQITLFYLSTCITCIHEKQGHNIIYDI